MTSLLRALLVLLVLLTMPASAGECSYHPTEPEVTTPATGLSVTGEGREGVYYVENDPCQLDCVLSVWVYEESNGIYGLQRGDEVVDDTCGGLIEPDTLVY